MTQSMVEERFHKIVSELAILINIGHREKVEEINLLMEMFARDSIALRYFLLKALNDVRFRTLVSSQSFYVFGCEEFYFRVNAWYPKSESVNVNLAKRLDAYFSIDDCHNHNIDFFTVGILGPGYFTEFKEAQDDLCNKKIGDKVKFKRTWSDQLKVGRAIFVPKQSVFHTQFKPDRYSMSFNLVIREPISGVQLGLGDDKETVLSISDLRGESGLDIGFKWF